MINLEMMKQLLQEFREKEALTTAEIEVVENEIRLLEQRVQLCHDKLKKLQEDKEKLTAMHSRYAGTSEQTSPPYSAEPIQSIQPNAPFPFPGQNQPAFFAGEQTLAQNLAQPEAPTFTQPEVVTPSPPETAIAQAEDLSGVQTEVDVEMPVSSLTEVSVTQAIEAEEIPEENNMEGIDEASNETIKSINDALKGLFRK